MSKLLSITQISKMRYRELCAAWLDGSLAKKWENKTFATKSEKTEEAQIRMIGFLLGDETEGGKRIRETLRGDNWSHIEFFRDTTDGDRCIVQVRL